MTQDVKKHVQLVSLSILRFQIFVKNVIYLVFLVVSILHIVIIVLLLMVYIKMPV